MAAPPSAADLFLGQFCERSFSAARWAQRFRRSRGGGSCLERLQPVFRAALHLSNARCVPRVGASRSIKNRDDVSRASTDVAISHMDVSRFAAPMSIRTTEGTG